MGKLDWPHREEFIAAPNNDYKMNGETMAKLRTSNGFSFMQVFNAGHMVPMDQPAVALQMVKDFTTGSLDWHTAADEVLVKDGWARLMLALVDKLLPPPGPVGFGIRSSFRP